jgi:hypothetical protein
MKRYTIKLNKDNSIFRTNTTNASKALDDLILGNMINMNPYLGKTKKIYTTIDRSDDTLDAMINELNDNKYILISNRDYRGYLKGDFDTEFAKAAKFLANYKPKKNSYKLYDDTFIKFFEDEIQIGYDLIPIYDLISPSRFSKIDDKTKNIIINFYITING